MLRLSVVGVGTNTFDRTDDAATKSLSATAAEYAFMSSLLSRAAATSLPLRDVCAMPWTNMPNNSSSDSSLYPNPFTSDSNRPLRKSKMRRNTERTSFVSPSVLPSTHLRKASAAASSLNLREGSDDAPKRCSRCV